MPPAIRIERPKLALPLQKSTPSDELGDYTSLIYGVTKIGKTSLAAQFPEALFAFFEPGGKGLSVFGVEINDWKGFKDIIEALKGEDGKRFRTVIIDTVDVAYMQCLNWTGQQNGFDHPGDMNDYGKSWQTVSREFQGCMNSLVALGKGVMFISHAKEMEFQRERGGAYNKLVPSMPTQASKYVTAFVDIIAYYGYYSSERFLTIRGTDEVDAGHRIVGHFLAEENGRREHIFRIPMGNSPEEGYANIVSAFNNQQESILRPGEDDTPDLGDKVRKPSRR